MPKILIIARHAKSARDQTSLPDHDRPLHKKGKHHLKQMEHWLDQQKISAPDMLVTSTALRTIETSKAYAKVWKLSKKKIKVEKKLYMASYDDLINIIEATDEKTKVLCIVWHNPWLTDLIQACGSDWINMPTCGIVIFRYTGKFRGNFETELCKVIAAGEPER